MSLFMSSGELVHLPTVAREVFDVTGAGDTVVSALAVALAAGASMVEAAIIANHAAGLVIREIGTASVGLDAIRALVRPTRGEVERVGQSPHARRPGARRWAKARAAGQVDRLHERLLRHHPSGAHAVPRRGQEPWATSSWSASTRTARSGRSRVPRRPIVPEDDRAQVLAALAVVDLVCLFDEDTPLELIAAIVPDVLVKGAGYEREHDRRRRSRRGERRQGRRHRGTRGAVDARYHRENTRLGPDLTGRGRVPRAPLIDLPLRLWLPLPPRRITIPSLTLDTRGRLRYHGHLDLPGSPEFTWPLRFLDPPHGRARERSRHGGFSCAWRARPLTVRPPLRTRVTFLSRRLDAETTCCHHGCRGKRLPQLQSRLSRPRGVRGRRLHGDADPRHRRARVSRPNWPGQLYPDGIPSSPEEDLPKLMAEVRRSTTSSSPTATFRTST